MKILNYFLIFSFTGVMLFFSSCKKEKESIENVSTSGVPQLKSSDGSLNGSYSDSLYVTGDGVVYSYYLNNTKMRTIDFSPVITTESDSTDEFVIIVPIFNADSSLSAVDIRQFTDLQGYVNYGMSIDINFEKYLEFRNNVIDYTTKNNIISQYESNGTVPASFDTWYNTEIGVLPIRIGTPVDVYKDVTGGSAWTHPAGYAMWMAPGFNNQVSRYNHHTGYGWMYVYDKTFYRKRIATIGGYGNRYVYFVGPLGYLNDRMSSFNTI